MNGKRASPGDPGEGPDETGGEDCAARRHEEPGETERFGLLEVTRLRKDDGRALLHFALAPEER